MSTIDFSKIWFKKLQANDDLSHFNCDNDDDADAMTSFINPLKQNNTRKKNMESHTFFIMKKQWWATLP